MADLGELWLAWDQGGRTSADLATLVHAAQPFVRSVVKAVPGSPEDDPQDLLSEAQIGLLTAINRYDPARGVKFESFAQHRIRGRAREAMRATDQLPRSARRRVTELLAMEQKLSQRLSRVPTDQELAGELRWTLRAVAEARRDVLAAQTAHWPSDDDRRAGETTESFSYDVIVERLAKALEQLDGPDRVVMVLYYLEEMGMREIAELLGVGAATVSNIRDRAALQVMSNLRGA